MKTLAARRFSRDRALSWAAVLVCLSVPACFRSVDGAKLHCRDSSNCPDGYSCFKATPDTALGMCTKRGADAGSPEAVDRGETGGPIGSTDVALGSGANGVSCTVGSDCQSGSCVDGLCCDKECKGACYACSQLFTGKVDGICAEVTAGRKDPRQVCVDETATNECGTDGTCDGVGACRKVGTDHVCATASCNGAIFTPVSTCDGMGTCKVVTPADCKDAPCDIVDGCRSACAEDKDCAGASYCNPTTKRCAAKKIDGDSCLTAIECSSTFCVDGVCCNKACTEKCLACSESLTTAKSGICSAVKVGTDPHDSCAIDTANPCGADGTCDGAGACRMTGTDHVCKPAACSAGTFTPAASCDGKGACGTAVPESCGAFTCDETNGCQKECKLDTECSAKSYCDAATKICTAKKDNGKVCAAAKECTSGNCVDGLCCNSKCDGLCNSCKKEHTNVADGTCASVSKGVDPYNSCADETATNKCGNTGMCDGAGACQKVDKTKSCGDASCSGATFTPASLCDGLGVCKAGSPTNCGNFQCSVTTGCLTTCTGNDDCSTATFCDTSLAKPVCTPKKGLGEACGTDGTKCTTGRCVNGVCCNTDCAATCYACNVTGSVGTCSAVASGTADPKGICKVSGTPCGQDGKCDGNGACSYPGTSTRCRDSSCEPSTAMETPAAYCDGKGTCPSMTAKHCDASNMCAADNKSCAGSCTSTSCGTGYYCNGTSCVPKKTSGTCQSAAECSSGFCADGVCCNAACTEQCKACNLSGSSGTCTRLASGQPATGHGSCTNAGTPCGGSCNGSSDACSYPSTSQACGTKSCSSDLTTVNASACNGSGSCTAANVSCGPTGYCDSNTTSCVSKGSGSCSSNVQCTSNNCSVGKCCPAGQTNYSGLCCPTGQINAGGICCNSGQINSGGICCNSGQTNCSGACVDKNTDNNNCGSCGNVCSSPNTCGGSGTPGVCGCTPNCGSRTCGAVPNGCGTSCGTCQPGYTCTNYQCACTPSVYYRDTDLDTYGDPNVTQSSCTATAGWVLRSGDCDDSNANIHYGVYTCIGAQRRGCTASGGADNTTCTDGCLNGLCRDDGTVGLAGWVTCGASKKRCTTSQGCNLDPFNSESPGSCDTGDYFDMHCDGPNDCGSGQVCCAYTMGYSYSYSCYNGSACPPDVDSRTYYNQVCDPKQSACPADKPYCRSTGSGPAYLCVSG